MAGEADTLLVTTTVTAVATAIGVMAIPIMLARMAHAGVCNQRHTDCDEYGCVAATDIRIITEPS